MARRSSTESICQQVTQEIIEEIERGTKPWEAPWQGGDDWPRNAKTKRPYQGINLLILYCARANLGFESDRWLTKRQAATMGGRVRPGEKGTTVIFGSQNYGKTSREQERRQEWIGSAYGFYRQYVVYNTEQCQGLPPAPKPPEPPQDCSFPRLSKLLAAVGADFRVGGTRAFYDPNLDFAQVPPCHLFFDGNNWPRTVCHELAHWTRHPSRLGPISRETGLHAYAWNEVVAELTAAVLCRRLGLSPSASSSEYIAEWLKVLKRDADAVADARPHARLAADYLLRQLT
jgi:antirestriction protein ArdC